MEVNLFKLGSPGYIGPEVMYQDQNFVDNTIPTVPQIMGAVPDSIDSQGGFFDYANPLKPVFAMWQWYNVATGEVYGEGMSEGFHVWADTDLQNVALRVRANGYSEKKVMALDLLPENPILLRRVPYVLYMAAVTGLILFATKRKKEVGKVTVQDVVPFLFIAGGLLAFSFVKQLLESLGIWDSKDTKDLDGASVDPGSFWNPNFWRTVKPDGAAWTYAITLDTAQQWASDLYNSFNAINDDEDRAIGVFKRCRTQANASFLCDVFERVYGQDCLTFLRGGIWPQDRLSDADVNTINRYILNLPKY